MATTLDIYPNAYPRIPSVVGDVTICVQPTSTFMLAFFRQGATKTLDPFRFPEPSGYNNVTECHGSGGLRYFISGTSPVQHPNGSDDWQWPFIDFQTSDWPSGVYVVAIYPVDTDGNPTTSLGEQFSSGRDITPMLPFSRSMTIFVQKPYQYSENNIAYILPIATYQAYNSTGGECFYAGCPPNEVDSTVSFRRPGGGLGGVQPREPTDPYDTSSPRQRFAHWDAPFIRWLMNNVNSTIDFYTDMDLDNQIDNPLVLPSGNCYKPRYKLLLSVGHHEYWSQNMRTNVQSYINEGGNYAIFSGNTCWWQVDFGYASGYPVTVTKKGQWPSFNESTLTGLSWKYGAGQWGTCDNGHWKNTDRPNVGYTVQNADHWAFVDTGLENKQTFGDKANDYLVGYECDGQPPNPPFSDTLATAQTQGWNQDGHAAMVFNGSYGPLGWRGSVFNCGTTDWARVLTDQSAASSPIVNQITKNVIRVLTNSGVPPVTQLKDGEVVFLYADNNRYVSRIDRGGGQQPLEAVKGGADVYTRLRVKVIDSEKVAFLADNNRYVSRIDRGSEGQPLEAAKLEPDPFSQFRFFWSPTGRLALMADNGKFVSRIDRGGGRQPLEAAKDCPDIYSQFLVYKW